MRKKPKSFIQSFSWVGVMLIVMGAIFAGIAIIIQLMHISPEGVNVTINGVRQPATLETVRSFKLIFAVAFGTPGLLLLLSGGFIYGRNAANFRRMSWLKENGVRVFAEATGFTQSNVRVNNRRLMRLTCAHTDYLETTYVFKSGALRMDPTPYLPEGKIAVYYDRSNMHRYFVDVDGSAEIGRRVV